MKIRQTSWVDLPILMDMFDYGRKLQRQLGNVYQWQNGDPSQAVLEADIQSGHSYVCVTDEAEEPLLPKGTIVATFYLLQDHNPLFDTLTNGDWLSHDPYVTIHRMCTNGKLKGASQYCMRWVLDHYSNIRIYTHETNKPMIHVIQKFGFSFCGHIFPADGEARNAYHYVANEQIKEVIS